MARFSLLATLFSVLKDKVTTRVSRETRPAASKELAILNISTTPLTEPLAEDPLARDRALVENYYSKPFKHRWETRVYSELRDINPHFSRLIIPTRECDREEMKQAEAARMRLARTVARLTA